LSLCLSLLLLFFCFSSVCHSPSFLLLFFLSLSGLGFLYLLLLLLLFIYFWVFGFLGGFSLGTIFFLRELIL
jgi:hypothetical protein